MRSLRKTRFFYGIQLLSSIIGLTTSLYLVIQHTRLKSGIQESSSICSLGKHFDCDVVAVGPYSEIFSIPLASIGAFYYFLLLFLGILAHPRSTNFKSFQGIMAYLGLMGILVDGVLLFIQIFSIRSICLFCVLSYFATILHLTMNLMLTDKTGVTSSWKETFRRKVTLPSFSIITTCSITMIAFSFGLYYLPSAIRMKSQAYEYVNLVIEKFVDDWKSKQGRSIEVRSMNPIKGNPDAKITITEFSDFECPHCRKAAFLMNMLMKFKEDRVRFVFKHFPLDQSCNPAIQSQFHSKACHLARLSHCAHKRGKFWQFHDLVFLEFSDGKELPNLDQIHQDLTNREILSSEEIQSCLRNDESLREISEDIQLGIRMDVKGTPSLFINGKPVTIPLTLDLLKRLVEEEEKILLR